MSCLLRRLTSHLDACGTCASRRRFLARSTTIVTASLGGLALMTAPPSVDTPSAGLADWTGSPVGGRGVSALERLTGRAFGTRWQLALPSGSIDEVPLRTALGVVIRHIDSRFSPYQQDSVISRFNRLAPDKSFDAGPEVATLVAEAGRLHALSGGAFDPTVGPLVHRYGFGPVVGDAGARLSDLEIGAGTLVKRRAGLTLDLCGIAKGHALDRMHAALLALGVTDFLLELGGELRGAGCHPDGRAWRTGIENPIARGDDPGARLVSIVELDAGRAIATSGTERQGFDHHSRRYSHLMDPKRRAPLVTSLGSVSVMASTAAVADAWSTALMTAGASEGPALARRHSVSALFVERTEDNLARLIDCGFAAEAV